MVTVVISITRKVHTVRAMVQLASPPMRSWLSKHSARAARTPSEMRVHIVEMAGFRISVSILGAGDKPEQRASLVSIHRPPLTKEGKVGALGMGTK